MNDKNWIDEARKSGLTPAEAHADDLVRCQQDTADAFKRVLTETRRALDAVKRKLQD